MTPDSIASIENHLKDLEQSGVVPPEVSLDSAVLEQNKARLLYESSLAQLMLTSSLAGKNLETGIQIKTSSNDAAPDIVRLTGSFPGLILGLLPSGSLVQLSRKDSAQFRERYFAQQASWPGLPISDSTQLLCVDSFTRGLPPQLYRLVDGGYTPRGYDEFYEVVNSLCGVIGANLSLGKHVVARSSNITKILFELFRNTHDHARVGIRGQVLPHSIRGLYSRVYPVNAVPTFLPASRTIEQLAKANPAERYASSVFAPDPTRDLRSKVQRDITGLLELSVFDSGPGFAARWKGKEPKTMSTVEQLEAVYSCLNKGHTTTGQLHRGYGLWNVLNELRNVQGFIRIRTNGINAFRDFHAGRDAQLSKTGLLAGSSAEVLFDWNNGTTTQSGYSLVAGSLIQILIPLGDL